MKSSHEEICRICGNYHAELMPIFKNEGIEHDLPKKIQQHFYSVSISETDNLPTRICYQCVSALVSWHDLFELCEDVDRKFHCNVLEEQNEMNSNPFTTKNPLIGSDNELWEQTKEGDDLAANIDAEVDTKLDLKMEDSNVMLVSIDNIVQKMDDDCLLKMSPTYATDDLLEPENDSHKLPNSTSDTGHGDHEDWKDDDLSSLEGNPPSIDFDPSGNFSDRYQEKISALDDMLAENVSISGPPLVRKKGQPMLPPACPICHKVFSCALTKRIHMRTIHSDERPYLCDLCSRSFKRKDHLNSHVKLVHLASSSSLRKYPKSQLLCYQCGRVFKNKTNFKDHMNSVHDNVMQYKCEPCNISFARYSALYHHRTVMNHRSQPQKKPFFDVCAYCGLEFESEYYYRRHVWKHEEHMNCEVCSIAFEDRSSFVEHIQDVHTPAKQSTCDICGKMFGNKVGLWAHRRVHNTEDRPYECDHCHWKFLKKGQLRVHMYRHTGESPYECPICGRGFKQKGDLRYHKATHVRFQGDEVHHVLTQDLKTVIPL